MDIHTLHILEYSSILELLSAHTTNSIGRDFAAQLEPVSYPETVVRRLQETREARDLRDMDGGMPLGGVYDIRSALDRARIETQLTGREIVEVRYTLEAARRLRSHLLNRRERAPLLAEMAANLPVLSPVESRIESGLNDTGEVKDSASPELARLRSQIKVNQNRLTDRLQSILSSERYKSYIQDGVITLREDRYCIPVKTEYAKAFGGIVHDASQSGATVFIEPEGTVELGNTLKQMVVQEQHEVSRILRELSALIGSYHQELQKMVSILGHLDVIHAKAILAEEMMASEPILNRKGVVKLRGARHPLIKGKVTPIDLEVGDQFTTVLITGPNTGGKTVALKTVGLLTLMTLAGLQIPALPDSEIALFDQVFADIGDEQDLQQSLSTFSAHVKNLVHIVNDLGSNALALLDEMGAGTDPAEGAALAKAYLDQLLERGARVVATTHYGELKEYAYSREGVENASVEFNRQTLSPTYRILLGVPGSSNAFYIAEKLGMPSEIVEEAKGFLSKRDIETGELLQQIEISRRNAHELEQKAERAFNDAEQAREEYETRVQQISMVQKTVRQQAQEEAREALKRSSEKAENILKDLQRMNKGVRKGSSVRQKLLNLKNETFSELQPDDTITEDIPAAPYGYEYKPGERVRVLSLNLDGQILDTPKNGFAAVQMGAMRATFPLNQLRPLKAAEEPKVTRMTKTGVGEIVMRKAMQISPELMLRAMRVDEALLMLDRYLDDACTAGLKSARIIHGKGTGALRSAVHQFLSSQPVVAAYRLGEEGEGGDGATIVTFK